MTLKAFLVEDSPVIRENLIESLHEMAPVEVVGTADNEAAALAWLTPGTSNGLAVGLALWFCASSLAPAINRSSVPQSM